MALDQICDLYVAGWTTAADFPVTPSAYQPAINPNSNQFVSYYTGYPEDVFVTKFSQAGARKRFRDRLPGVAFALNIHPISGQARGCRAETVCLSSRPHNVTVDRMVYQGRKAVRVTSMANAGATLRPGEARRADDQERRNHSTQYASLQTMSGSNCELNRPESTNRTWIWCRESRLA